MSHYKSIFDNVTEHVHTFVVVNVCRFCNSNVNVLNAYAVHPADVGRNTGEHSGLPVSVAGRGRHEAGHTVDNPLAVNVAVQGAAGVTLNSVNTHLRQTPEQKHLD